jgi:hypothetical protein
VISDLFVFTLMFFYCIYLYNKSPVVAIYIMVDRNTFFFQSFVIEFQILVILPNDYFCIHVYYMAIQSLVYLCTSCSFKGKQQVVMAFPSNVKNYINIMEKHTFLETRLINYHLCN